MTTFDCANAPGPQITFDGSMVLSGVDVQLAGGIAAGEEIVIPKQPSRGGVGGNPFVWIQIVDMNGQPSSNEIFLGRCVRGPVEPIDFVTPVLAQAMLEVLDCTNNPGPFINVSGSGTFDPGVKARFIFRNNDNPVGGPHEADAIVDITLVTTGFTLTFPKQPVQGGVGGNPWISAQFVNGSGQPIGPETLLGRCVQLMPGN